MGLGIDIAVIPAAGEGTRMRPLSLAVPKEMLPVGRWPMLQYAVMEAVWAGVKEIVVVLPPERKKEVLTYLERMYVPGQGSPGRSVEGEPLHRLCDVKIVHQPQPDGLADAIGCARAVIAERPFFVLLPDNVFFAEAPSTRQMAEAFEEFHCEVLGLIEVTQANAWRFSNAGRVEWQPLTPRWVRLTHLHDKRPGSFELGAEKSVYRNCGRYVLTADFLDTAEALRGKLQGELDDVPVLQRLIREKQVIGVPLRGHLFDVGHWDGYFSANAYWLKREGLWN